MIFDKEFKEAITNLPEKEKDKLLFRLLKKDLVLVNKLHFELVSTNSIDEERSVIEDRIETQIKRIADNFYSPGYSMMELRYLSGEITGHVKRTKDKFGEASLNLLMLNEFMTLHNVVLQSVKKPKTYKLFIYIIARTFKILLLIQALDEDYFLDFKEDLIILGRLFSVNHELMQLSIYNGFDVNWLLQASIPKDLKQIHKEIRAQGFLK